MKEEAPEPRRRPKAGLKLMRPSRRELLRVPLGLLGLALPRLSHAAENAEPLVVLQPLGSTTPAAELEAVSSAIAAFYAVRVTVATPLALPKSAFYPKRQRYRAERLLDFLVAEGQKDARVTLGLTAVDISTSKAPYEDWGILGLATLDGRSPGHFYFPSTRQMPDEVLPPTYPGHHAVRSVRLDGTFRFRGDTVFLSESLTGEPIGLEEFDSDRFLIRFGPIELATLDCRAERPTLIRLPGGK